MSAADLWHALILASYLYLCADFGPPALGAAETVPIDQTLLEAFLGSYCEPVMKAMERIGVWLDG